MKMNAAKLKKHARKLKGVSEDEFKKLQGSYEKLMKDVRHLDEPALIMLMVVGIAIILLFSWGIFDFVGLLVLIYAVYLFARQEGHEEGFYEGYYENAGGRKESEGV